ncbi:haloacid dehalogenase type II [Persicobacter sp. CCB-QB2]|uniref:haloacid dehalogenase type II n=1 Tax=Persicobacter sp. CCB-QB2 TaxID=1561025 RepID=UPI0006A94D18|nr:haloacid dehalogenase type II [Persicobacter sp. CCB-QB2]
MKVKTLAFDVLGTLANTSQAGCVAGRVLGDLAADFMKLWKQKHVEYAFRAALMDQYQPQALRHQQAFDYCLRYFHLSLSSGEQRQLLAAGKELSAFPEVKGALKKLKAAGFQIFAFSNSAAPSIAHFLAQNHLAAYFDGIVSLDEVQLTKPQPAAYQYLLQQSGAELEEVALISSNPFDLIGAQSSGLSAYWVRRDAGEIFDPWGLEPDVVVEDFERLYTFLCSRSEYFDENEAG